MALPPKIRALVIDRVGAFCDRKNRGRPVAAGRIDYEQRGASVTIVENRPHFEDRERKVKHPTAQLRYHAKVLRWTLHWRRHTGKWVAYDRHGSSWSLDQLLREIELDPMAVFWG